MSARSPDTGLRLSEAPHEAAWCGGCVACWIAAWLHPGGLRQDPVRKPGTSGFGTWPSSVPVRTPAVPRARFSSCPPPRWLPSRVAIGDSRGTMCTEHTAWATRSATERDLRQRLKVRGLPWTRKSQQIAAVDRIAQKGRPLNSSTTACKRSGNRLFYNGCENF